MGLSPTSIYLILYNILCCAGWATVLALGLQTVINGIDSPMDALASVYDRDTPLPSFLFYVQSAALLEIVHAGLGFVRSPLFVTTMQVGSRIAALFAIVNSPMSQGMFFHCFFRPVSLNPNEKDQYFY